GHRLRNVGFVLIKNVVAPTLDRPVPTIAQVKPTPAAIAEASWMPLTATGTGLESGVPFPSEYVPPQQWTAPPRMIAQVWLPPAAIAVASPMPTTRTGVRRSLVVPSPSCPLSLRPQHLTWPPATIAQL